MKKTAVRFCEVGVRLCGAFVVVVGLVGLLGWIFDAETLKAVLGGGVTMKANAAVCLMLLGTALILLAPERGRSRRRVVVGRVAAGVAMAVGGLTVAEHLGGPDFGIDQVLFHEPPGSPATASPGRMGPPASASFFLSGLALLLLDLRMRRGAVPSQWLALLVGLIALLPLIGYTYSVDSLYGVARYTGIAIHMAVAIAALAMGLFVARPTAGLMAQVSADDAGGVMARRLLLPAILIPLVIGWLRTVGERAGLYDAAFGRSLLILSLVVSFAALVWSTARTLSAMGRDRTRADQARRMSEFRWQRTIEQSPLSTQVFAPDGTVRQVNRAWERLWGVTLGDIPGYNILQDKQLVERGIMPAIRQAFAGEAATAEPIPYVLDRGPYAGQSRWCGAYVYPVKDDAGRIEEVVLVHNDVTEQRLAEEAVRHSERQLRSLVEQSAAGIARADLTGRIVFANERFRQITGRPMDELLRLRVHDLTHPDDLDQTTHLVSRGAATGDEYAMEKRYVRPDGSVVWVAVSSSVMKDAAGNPQSIMGVVIDISDRKRAEEQLHRSRDTFYNLIQNNPFGVYVVDADFRLREVSLGSQKVFAHVPRPLLGRDFAEVLRSVWAEPFASEAIGRFRHTLATGEPYVATRTVERRQDVPEVEAYDWRIERVTLPDGRFGVVCYFYDLTDRQRLEAALRESEERFRLMADAVPQIVWITDAEGRVQFFNQHWSAYTGIDYVPATADDVAATVIHPDDRPATKAAFDGALRTGGTFAVEHRIRSASGEYRWFLVRGEPYRDPQTGRITRWFGASVDIHDRRQAEEALRESEGHARRIIDNTLAFIGVMTPDGTLSEANANAVRGGGLRREDVLGKKFWDCYWWSYDPQVQARLRAAVARAAAGEVVRYDVVVRMAGDSRMPIDFMLSPVRSERGQVTHLIPSGVDIAERERAEAAVRESERRFRELADAMPQMVWVTRPDGHHEYYNRRWYEFTGVPEGSTDGEGWNRMFHPDDQDRAWAAWRRSLATGEPYEIEYRLRHHSGAYRWTLGRALPVRNARGEIERWFGTCTDIDAIKRWQQEREHLLDSERNARAEAERAGHMKDEFLATLSHELRTPLNAIVGWSQILRNGTPSAEDLKEGLATIQRNAHAQTQIIEDLLDMSRIISGKIRLDVQRIDPAAVVQAAVDTMRPAADAKGVRLQAMIDPKVGPVGGDPGRLHQVFWNLISNAIKFTPRGGRVQVLLERVNSHIEVSVIDTGEGIRPEFLPSVFDRFRQADASTTRRHGGLGLGLSIVKQLVELHGGTVRASSAGPGQGSTFVVALPLTAFHRDPDAEPDGDAERRHPRAGLPTDLYRDACLQLAGIKVLVVDDEADARAIVKRLLEDCAATVTTAATADEAVRAVESERPDVLVSDIGMPGEDGYSLIRRVRALGEPKGGGVPALALTAYARAEDRVRAVRAGFQTHVVKPVEPAELITMVASLAGRTIM